MSKRSIFTVGGTVQAGEGIYIPRPADDELLSLCRSNTYAHVLTPRQMGKSSLMERTAQQLREEGFVSITIDLSQIGTQVDETQWYLGILTLISDHLNLKTDVLNWWGNNDHLGITQRFILFFQKVLLGEVTQKVVIFIDEIDTTLSLSFADDFYIAIRYLYNARAEIPEFKNLSFVLIGVATPGDLINDPQRTPFNIGKRVDLTDFTFEQAKPFAIGFNLPEEAALDLLRLVMKWTGGHPYLTQRLCQIVTEKINRDCTESDIDKIVAFTFFGQRSEEDNNLQFVRDMLTERAPDKNEILKLYKEIRRGKRKIRDEEQSIIKSHLKLSGVVKSDEHFLRVRNRIYAEVFNPAWIRQHLPINWIKLLIQSKQAVITLTTIFLTIAITIALLAYRQMLDEIDLREKIQDQKAEVDRLIVEKERETILAKESEKKTKENEEKAIEASKREAIARTKAQEEAEKNKEAAEEILKYRKLTLVPSLIGSSKGASSPVSALLSRQSWLIDLGNINSPQKTDIYESLRNSLNRYDDQIGGPVNLYFTSFIGDVIFYSNDVLLVADGDMLKKVEKLNNELPINIPYDRENISTIDTSNSSIKILALSQDSQYLACGRSDNKIKLIYNVRLNDAVQSNNFAILYGHKNNIRSLIFCDNFLISGDANGIMFLWDLEPSSNILDSSLTPSDSLKLPSPLRVITIQPETKKLFTGGDDDVIRIFAIQDNVAQNNKNGSNRRSTFIVLDTMQIPSDDTNLHKAKKILSLAFNSDGKTLAAGLYDGRIFHRTLEKKSWDSVLPKRKEEKPQFTLAFSPDGSFLASGTMDNFSLRELNKPEIPPFLNRAGRALYSYSPDDFFRNKVSKVIISPDNQYLISLIGDQTMQIWNIQIKALANKVCEVVSRNLSWEEWKEFVGEDIPYQCTCSNLPPGEGVKWDFLRFFDQEFKEFYSQFTPKQFDKLHLSLSKDITYQHPGKPLDRKYWWLTNEGVPFDDYADSSGQFFLRALYRYRINDDWEGFIIEKKLSSEHSIKLYLYDNQKHKMEFSDTLAITSLLEENFESITESWIVDLNNDGFGDIYHRKITQTIEPNKNIVSDKKSAKVWQTGKFIDLDIEDKNEIRDILNLEF